MKKSLIFVALFSVFLFSNCKHNDEVKPEEQMEKIVTDSISTITDSVKTDDTTPAVAPKDTLKSPTEK